MLKSIAVSSVLALSLVACATPPAAPNATTAAAKPAAACVPETASRLPPKNDICAGFGSTHTKQDVDNTGQQDLSRALPMIDPAVTRTGPH